MTTATLSKSTRKDKKWMVRHGTQTTHFGSANMRVFTLLSNIERTTGSSTSIAPEIVDVLRSTLKLA